MSRSGPGPVRTARPPGRRAATAVRRADSLEAARDVERVPHGACGPSARASPNWTLLSIGQHVSVQNLAQFTWIATTSTFYSTQSMYALTARDRPRREGMGDRFLRESSQSKAMFRSPASLRRSCDWWYANLATQTGFCSCLNFNLGLLHCNIDVEPRPPADFLAH